LTGAWPSSSRPSFDKEIDDSCEVVDNNADVVHPLKRHGPEHGAPWPSPGAMARWREAQLETTVNGRSEMVALFPAPTRLV
jgi:hypothetical protein